MADMDSPYSNRKAMMPYVIRYACSFIFDGVIACIKMETNP